MPSMDLSSDNGTFEVFSKNKNVQVKYKHKEEKKVNFAEENS
jgi:hypothetical protein